MKTPRLPAMVSSHETAKRSALGLPAPSVRAKTLRMSQTSAAAASSIPPGRSSQRFARSAGNSAPNGAPQIASAAAGIAGSGASGVIAHAKARSLSDNDAARITSGAAKAATRRPGPNCCAAPARAAHRSASPAPGRPICRKAKNAGGAKASRTAASASVKRDVFARPARRLFQLQGLVRERRLQHPVEIPASEQSARQHHHSPDPLAGLDRGLHQEPFGGEAAAGRQPHEREPAETQRQERDRHRPPGAAETGDPVVAEGFGDQARRRGTSPPWRRRATAPA